MSIYYTENIENLIGKIILNHGNLYDINEQDITRDVAILLYKTIQKDRNELIEKMYKLPTICGVCEKPGTNTYGECKCSYDVSKFVLKEDVLNLIKQNETTNM